MLSDPVRTDPVRWNWLAALADHCADYFADYLSDLRAALLCAELDGGHISAEQLKELERRCLDLKMLAPAPEHE